MLKDKLHSRQIQDPMFVNFADAARASCRDLKCNCGYHCTHHGSLTRAGTRSTGGTAKFAHKFGGAREAPKIKLTPKLRKKRSTYEPYAMKHTLATLI